MFRFGFAVVCVLSVGVAGYAVAVYGGRPLGSAVHPDMRIAFESRRPAISAHIFASAVALLTGPWQFVPGLRATRPRLHRHIGRVYLLAGVGVGGGAGLYMSWFAFGGWVSTSGFGLLAVGWLYTGFRGYRAARRGAFADHRRWMVRNFALTLAAVTLRVYLGLVFAAGLPFEAFYPPLAWLSWVPNAVAAELLVRRPSEPVPVSHPAGRSGPPRRAFG